MADFGAEDYLPWSHDFLEAGILNHHMRTEYFFTEKVREYGFADQEFIG